MNVSVLLSPRELLEALVCDNTIQKGKLGGGPAPRDKFVGVSESIVRRSEEKNISLGAPTDWRTFCL